MTPIHVVERIRTEYVENPDGDAWIWTDDYEYKAFDNFDDMVAYVREKTKGDYPEYGDIEYEDVEKDGEEIWVEKHNCENCRVYTRGLGYSNNGDLPVFRALLMRMGEMIAVED